MSHSDSELYKKSFSNKGKMDFKFNNQYAKEKNSDSELYLSDHIELINDWKRLSISSDSDSNLILLNEPENNSESSSSEELDEHSNHTICKSNPDCCLFVASLVSSKTEEELIESVRNHFTQWGKVVDVKVMKDSMNRPYGFVQFINPEIAKLALEESANTCIDGRHIRVEKARVNRTIFLYRLNPANSIEQIIHMAGRFGYLEDAKILRNSYDNKHKGCGFFKFKFREDAIKAYSTFRSRYPIGVEWVTYLEKTPRYFDFCSIFIGNLPISVTRTDLEKKFENYGEIIYIHMFPRGDRAFSFIKYKDYSMSIKAIETEDGAYIHDTKIKVSFKESGYFKQHYKCSIGSGISPKSTSSIKYIYKQAKPNDNTAATVSYDRPNQNYEEIHCNRDQGNHIIYDQNTEYRPGYNNAKQQIFNGNFYQNKFNRESRFKYRKHPNGNLTRNSYNRGHNFHHSPRPNYNQQPVIPYSPLYGSPLSNSSQSPMGSPQTPLFYPPPSPYYPPSNVNSLPNTNNQFLYPAMHVLTQLPDGSYGPSPHYTPHYYIQATTTTGSQSQVLSSPLTLPPPQLSELSNFNQHHRQVTNTSNQLGSNLHVGSENNFTPNSDNSSNASDENTNSRSIYDQNL